MSEPNRRVASADGVQLAVYESGDPHATTLVAIHGFPDNHTVWDGVAAALADRFHVVTYDVRGAGASGKPRARAAYRMPNLVADLAAVVEAVSPDAPVHLVGHDWGSIQAWPALLDERLAGRIAAFTSISGPSLDYSTAWLRDVRSHPRDSLRQLAHSYYILAFQLPALPERAVRAGLVTRGARSAGGIPASVDEQLNGIQLYRANILGPLRRPVPQPTNVPVQVIAPDDDPFVTPALATGAPARWVSDLTVRSIAGGHWVLVKQPQVIASLVVEYAETRAT